MKRKTRRTNKKRTRKNKSRTNKKIMAKGLNNRLCAICENNVNVEDTFVPQSCFRKNLNKSHRICSKCWWDKFAKENADHQCPGCKKGLPLNKGLSEEVIEISD